MKPRLRAAKVTLQHILDQHLDSFIEEGLFNTYQIRILKALQFCRTEALGGHWQVCGSCGTLKVHYNSCGNRHCPSCQGVNRERWISERNHDLFDVPYHHLTFTVPQQLRVWFKMNEKQLYNLLFSSMWETLLSFSKDPRSRLQAKIGVISILHTWTQKLDYHPHLHCIVPAGGLLESGKWKAHSGKYLFSVKALSIVFKHKFCHSFAKLYQKGSIRLGDVDSIELEKFVEELKKLNWGVHSKPGFRGKDSVIEYLGRYTHKIAISNYRLLKLEHGKVTFSYRDRKKGDIKKVMTLAVKEFLLRFVQHILPKRFVKIRHYGIFSARVKKQALKLICEDLNQSLPIKQEKLNAAQIIEQTTGIDISICSHCQEGQLITIKIIPRSRGSPDKQVKQGIGI